MPSIRIAIDVESGDYGPSVIVQGVLEALSHGRDAFSVHLCGNQRTLNATLAALGGAAANGIVIEHCPDTVSSRDTPSRVWREHRGASIVRCIGLQAEGRTDASISAGDTRILMPASLFLLGRVHGVSRPALAAFVPTTGEHPVLLLDVGANLECRVEHLVSFALMGSDYFGRFCGIPSPRVAMLNIGLEPTKGTRAIVEAGRILRARCGGFVGFIEGSRVLSGDADVVVCDGFAGNVLLKVCGSFYQLAEAALAAREPAMLGSLRKHMTIFNPESYGAAPILGVNGVVFKAHGNSSPRAIATAIALTATAVRQKVVCPDRGTAERDRPRAAAGPKRGAAEHRHARHH